MTCESVRVSASPLCQLGVSLSRFFFRFAAGQRENRELKVKAARFEKKVKSLKDEIDDYERTGKSFLFSRRVAVLLCGIAESKEQGKGEL